MSDTLQLVGIDEAGRGPLAGPVAVGVVAVAQYFDWNMLPGVNDSKQVTERTREEIFVYAYELKEKGMLDFAVSLVSASTIDRVGISRSVALGIERGLARLALNPATAIVKLDGLLKAPQEFAHQETIIKGDAKELVIGLASILAKVSRDRLMLTIAKKYPDYSFESHKGYGTKVHEEAIRIHGLSPVHRRSFCKKFL